MRERSAREVRVVHDAAALATAGAAEIARAAAAAVAERGRFSLVLAGGRTPRSVYERLAEGEDPELRSRIDWERTWLVCGDERPVPPDHPDSNYGMARAALLLRVPVPPGHVIRFHAEDPDRDACVRRYEAAVRQSLAVPPSGLPRFDLVLLGMGPDGHTASLFPGTDALRATGGIATVTWVETLRTFRYTLTAPAINAARRVVFLVSGADKAETLHDVLDGPLEPERLPAQLVRPADGSVLWIVDEPAAARL